MKNAKIILVAYFGNNFEKILIGNGYEKDKEDVFLTKEQILNPTKEDYLLVKKIVNLYQENNFLSKKLEQFLGILAAMTSAIPDDIYKEWDGSA